MASRFMARFTAMLLLLPLAAGLHAGEAGDSLPDPLTLEAALGLADGMHPELLEAEAGRDKAAAERLAAEAVTGTRVDLQARARWIDPSDVAGDQSHGDHLATLTVSKPLLDFGRSANLEAAAEAAVSGADQRYEDARRRRRLEIMQRFFDVLLADQRYTRDNEELAVVYVALDKLRDRHELGQISDIELLEAESGFQRIRRQVRADEAQQRISRARLAQALNRPGDLPSNLVEPNLEGVGRELPPLDVLTEQVLGANPDLQVLRQEVAAAEARLRAAQAAGNPTLSAELEAGSYARDLGGRDPWRAGLVLDVPLYSGGKVKAEAARRSAELKELRARLTLAEWQAREEARALWEEIGVLAVQRDEVRAQGDYRDLYLDRSRALYEMEVKTDLGDSMVRLSEARLERLTTECALAVAWAKLDALVGRDIELRGE